MGIFERLLDWAKHSQRCTPSATERNAAKWFSDLFAEDAPCGFEAPVVSKFVDGERVEIPDSWVSALTPDDARALARMLLRAADEADAKGKP